MSLIALKIPAGIVRNGTEFEQSNRWRDANLVRLNNQSLSPVGVWTERSTSGDTLSGVVRGMLAWIDNSN